MTAPVLGEAATHLPWLSPSAGSLAALACAPSSAAWLQVRTDPGAVLLILRHAPSAWQPTAPLITPSLLQAPGLLEDALFRIDSPVGCFADWDSGGRAPVYRASLKFGRFARAVAERCGRCDPDSAWAAGLLAPLGWLAVALINADSANACLSDPENATNGAGVQHQRWGLDQASITRRLCRRWNLPRWLAAVIGHLDLVAESAAALGAPVELFCVTQLAVSLAQEKGAGVALAIGASLRENGETLGLRASDLEQIIEECSEPAPDPTPEWQSPDQQPLLRELLRLALELRRSRVDPSFDRLEADVDHLHRALREQRSSEEDRLRAMKLAALAEFAAGASHEINNPLAVISGQAQYLLNDEPDPSRQRALHTVVSQARRIHDILSQLMHFARPPHPDLQAVDVARLVRDVTIALADFAHGRRVRIENAPVVPGLHARGDVSQLETALGCLLRNAVEAAPPEGCARIRVERGASGWCEFVVEDNGGGPSPAQVEHLFDPFYSGRHAGRGRGLGLPTAWRLARNQGGDVHYAGRDAGVTRFVLSVPGAAEPTLGDPTAAQQAVAVGDGDGSGPVHNGQIRVRLVS